MSLMYTQYKDKPFQIFAIPSNQYGNQEPNSNQWIEKFVRGNGTHICGRIYCDWKGYFPYPLLAKATVKPEWCTADPAKSCTATSSDCCSKNDEVYKWLNSLPMAQPQGVPKWNFAGKLIFDKCGNPIYYKNDETFMPDKLSDQITEALNKAC